MMTWTLAISRKYISDGDLYMDEIYIWMRFIYGYISDKKQVVGIKDKLQIRVSINSYSNVICTFVIAR